MRYIIFIKETIYYLFNYGIANVIVLIMKIFNIRIVANLWIFGGNGGQYYSDNSAILHQYVEENHPEIDAFWVINRSSPDIKKIKNKNKVLFKHSVKANVYVMLADVLICSHSIRGDIMRASPSKFKHAITVDLFHGITAFKDKTDYPKNDLVIATSEEEKQIKLNWRHNHEENIVITGFARYDKLFEQRDKVKLKKEIFYMPTWRPWLKKSYVDPSETEKEEFQKSKFYTEIFNFLTSKELHKLLKEKKYKLNVFVHMNMHQYIDQFEIESNNIKLLERNIDVQEYLIHSELLITDYSSVAWDFLFLDKPTFFYVFDLDEYQQHVNSCIDMTRELFGPTAFDSQEMVNNIEDYFNGILKIKDEYPVDKMKEKFIKYDDNRNCERIVNTIYDAVNNNKL